MVRLGNLQSTQTFTSINPLANQPVQHRSWFTATWSSKGSRSWAAIFFTELPFHVRAGHSITPPFSRCLFFNCGNYGSRTRGENWSVVSSWKTGGLRNNSLGYYPARIGLYAKEQKQQNKLQIWPDNHIAKSGAPGRVRSCDSYSVKRYYYFFYIKKHYYCLTAGKHLDEKWGEFCHSVATGQADIKRLRRQEWEAKLNRAAWLQNSTPYLNFSATTRPTKLIRTHWIRCMHGHDCFFITTGDLGRQNNHGCDFFFWTRLDTYFIKMKGEKKDPHATGVVCSCP